MNAQTCDGVRDRLTGLRDGTLPALEAAATRAHVARCASCAAELDLLGELAGARRKAPRGFAEGVLAAWRAERGEPAGTDSSAPASARDDQLRMLRAERAGSAAAQPRRPRLLGQGLLPVAATAAGVLLLGTLLARGGFRAEPDANALAVTAAEAGVSILPWPGDDGVLAGAPALDALSNAEIEALLEELDS